MNNGDKKRTDFVLQLFNEHKIIFGLIFGIWLLFFLLAIFVANDLTISWPPSMKLEELNSFGGNFNVLTSLFTGLAFAGLIISIILQTKELQETRKEFEGQKLALEIQAFDNKFFQMLGILNNIRLNLNLNEATKGVDVFVELHKKLTKYIFDEFNINSNETNKFLHFKEVFEGFNDEYDTTFKYYYLNLYQILKYIDDKSPKDKVKLYSNIVRAHLTKSELVLLAYNAIGVQNFTSDNYQQLIEKYALFEHLKFDDFVIKPKILGVIKAVLVKYEVGAFGKNSKFIEALARNETGAVS